MLPTNTSTTNIGGSAFHHRQMRSNRPITLTKSIVFASITGIACFYLGLLLGSSMHANSIKGRGLPAAGDCWSATDGRLEAIVQSRVKEQVAAKLEKAAEKYLQEFKAKEQHQQQEQEKLLDAPSTTESVPRFPAKSMGKFATGMSRVDRDSFAAKFDMGVPLDKSEVGNNEVVILHGRKSSLPSSPHYREQASTMAEVPLMDSVEDAVQNCYNLHVILTDFSRENQCLAIMGQYEAFHIQKFMRLPPDEVDGGKPKGLDADAPLRLVNRGAQASGRKSARPPTREQTLEYWSTLTGYLQSFESTLDKLRPIAESVAKSSSDGGAGTTVTNGSIVVMVCNHGQSELLMNFVCHAKSRNLDLSNILVFATDEETVGLCEGLGIRSFYDESVFGSMPKQAAGAFADRTFMAMMAAKVYCVQMVNMLGYDVLFQDVDLVWYKNPLEYFYNHDNYPDFDIYFQDDGNHALFYAPYSANTGFYYVRYNDRTQYFFNSLLLAGDLILSTHSHQNALIALLNEHASMYGLRVKIFERHTEEFPGGFSYHRMSDFMKELARGEVHPYIFHMSWTHNKDNKKLFFQQMGEWYLDDRCVGTTANELGVSGHESMIAPCCLSEPNVICHYRDKPSKIPCTDSPPIDKGGQSFW